MNLPDQIAKWKELGRPIGFSPWQDAEGTIWGIVVDFDRSHFTVREISPLGDEEETNSYRCRSVSYFDADLAYSERLVRLMGFTHTLPDVKEWIKQRSRVREILVEAWRTGEIVRVRLRSESSSRTVLVLACEGPWVHLEDLDDLARPRGREIWRVSAVLRVQWRTAHEEADMFLARTGESGVN